MSNHRRCLILAATGLLAASALAAWYWLYRDTTIYAPRFTEANFSKVVVGMAKEEVFSLLGPPLSIDAIAVPETWVYEDISAERDGAEIAFDDRGSVIGADLNISHRIRAGMSKDKILKLLGRPSRVIRSGVAALSYSRPGGEVIFKGRVVELDANDKVSRIVKYQFHD